MAIEIVAVRTDAPLIERFLDLPETVYCGDPSYRAPARRRMLAGFHVLLAMEDGEPVARAATRVNADLCDDDGRPFGMVGLFEALNRPDAVRQLLAEAVGSLRRAGCARVIGPINGDTWHSYRLNLGPFDHPLFPLEPCNPVYYPILWEQAGFSLLEGYYSKHVPDISLLMPRYRRIHARVTAQGYRLRPLALDRFEDDLAIIYDLTCDTFRENYLYTAIPRAEFIELYRGVKQLVAPELVQFVMDPDGVPAGFIFCFPDAQGNTMNVKTLGVVKQYRRAGLSAALMFAVCRNAIDMGLHGLNLCLIRDGNPSGGLDGGHGAIFRRYGLYEHIPGGDAE